MKANENAQILRRPSALIFLDMRYVFKRFVQYKIRLRAANANNIFKI